MEIIQAISDRKLFRPFIAKDGSLASWNNWNVFLRTLFGLRLKSSHAELILKCTGRDYKLLPPDGFKTALCLTGRRSGKSVMAAIMGAYIACLSGREELLSPGEVGLVAILAPTIRQAKIILSYLRAIFRLSSLLENEIVRETKNGFELSNGVTIEILPGDPKTVRGFTLLAAIVDEVCFFGLDAESKVRNSDELIQALRPALATTDGMLICISSPYAKRGWAYKQFKKYFGNNNGSVLIWNSPSRTMNPTLSKKIVDQALEEDRASASAEFLGQFRDDISILLAREIIESVIIKGRLELLPRTGIQYRGFVDVSGGRNDAAAIAIGHKDKKVVVDYLKKYRPPHNPYEVIADMSEQFKRFNINKATGDNYSAEFVVQAFQNSGINYEKSKLNKSQLYLELLPAICSNSIELLDDETLINQLSNLERRTRSGGKDIVDHPQGGHDDSANVVAGLNFIAAKNHRRKGPLW